MTFWSLTNSDFPTNQTFHQFHDIDTELDLHRFWVVSMEHLQRVWHASRERLPFPDTWFRLPLRDLLVLQLLRPDSSNLPCLYSTFQLEYPLVLSRFCFVLWGKGGINGSRYSIQKIETRPFSCNAGRRYATLGCYAPRKKICYSLKCGWCFKEKKKLGNYDVL